MALANNPNRKGLIHHSDRGLQSHSAHYVALLKPFALISMTENSDPLENAIAERVNGILKDELLERRFDTFAEAELSVAIAISTYNNLRPHGSVDMLMPAIALGTRYKMELSSSPATLSLPPGGLRVGRCMK